ncbi:MAG: cellulase family glycosylhydrolase [Gaiellaceae bacterium]
MARAAAVRLALAAALALAVAAVDAAIAPAPAAAAPHVKFGITDDAWLQDGPGPLSSRVARLQSLGAQVVRFTLDWNRIATTEPAVPTDPQDAAYDWSDADTVLNALHASGMTVVLQLNGTPAWANGGLPPNYAPTSPTSFRDFATAAATRYPWVKRWLIWNEPNQVRWLRPTSPAVYTARLLDPAYEAIHEAIPGAQVAGGGTAPRGATGGVSPVAWIAGMHRAHARLDAYAHNPYPLDPRRESPFRGTCTKCMTITMASLGRLVSRVARFWKHARIWLTEYGYQTNPPDRLLGVSYALQARYLSDADYVAFRTPRVDLLIHFLYKDEPNVARFQSGLVTLGNRVKPALAAFGLPLAETARSGTRTSLWGQFRAPGTGSSARIERRERGGWRTVATVRAGAGRFFRWRGTLPRRSVVRLQAGRAIGAPLTIT